MPLQPVQRRSVADAVFDQLLDGLLTGELDAGEELPAERALTHTLGVNRQAVREALQRLAAAGLVEIRHGGKTRARDYRRAAGLDLLPRLLLTDAGVDPDVARSIMELRTCLGTDIARRCAQRSDAKTHESLARVVADMAASEGDHGALIRLDLRFWDTLVDGSHNIAYRLAFNGLRQTYEPVAEMLAPTLADELRDHAARAAIVGAVGDGDASEAAAVAERLLRRGEASVSALLDTLAGEQGSNR